MRKFLLNLEFKFDPSHWAFPIAFQNYPGIFHIQIFCIDIIYRKKHLILKDKFEIHNRMILSVSDKLFKIDSDIIRPNIDKAIRENFKDTKIYVCPAIFMTGWEDSSLLTVNYSTSIYIGDWLNIIEDEIDKYQMEELVKQIEIITKQTAKEFNLDIKTKKEIFEKYIKLK